MSKADEETEDVYDVEVVLDRKIINGTTFYLLKWIGYSDDYNTWEPEANLHCRGLIEDYLNRPDRILGATEENGDIKFIIRTKSLKNVAISSILAYKQCPQMIIEFYEQRLNWTHVEHPDKVQSLSDSLLRKMRRKIAIKSEEQTHRPLIPAAIIGVLNTSEGLVFLMKWRDSDQFDLISAVEAKVRYPKCVLEFYEEKLKWTKDFH